MDTAGHRNDCPGYEPCPLCYGCRNYDRGYFPCISMCGGNLKRNVCNRKKHGAENLASFITKETVEI